MNGWLIYDKAGATRNEWFIRRLQERFAKRNIALPLKIYDNLDESGDFFENLPDFAIVRTICPSLNGKLEERGVRVFNNAKTAKTANDKWQTYLFCEKLGLPVLPTYLPEKISPIAFPCVIKSVDGHGGSEVFLANDEVEYEKAVERLLQAGKRAVVQKANAVAGEDVRAYVIGGEIIACVKRTSTVDFRSNFSLGGEVKLVFADETQKAIVKKLHETLRLDFVGVDFLPDGKGGYVVNEIEDSAGARMLYKTSDIDVADVFAEYVASVLTK